VIKLTQVDRYPHKGEPVKYVWVNPNRIAYIMLEELNIWVAPLPAKPELRTVTWVGFAAGGEDDTAFTVVESPEEILQLIWYAREAELDQVATHASSRRNYE
jgi:hypothetical protein